PDKALVVTLTQLQLAGGRVQAHAAQGFGDCLAVGATSLFNGLLVGIGGHIGAFGVVAGGRVIGVAVFFDKLFVALVVMRIEPVTCAQPDVLGHSFAQGSQHFGGGTNRHEDFKALIEKVPVVGLADKVDQVTAP